MDRPDTSDRTYSMPPAAPTGMAEEFERARRLQLSGWGAGQAPLVEGLLQQHPTLADHAERVLDLIYHEVLFREARGERPTVDDYQKRFPRLADKLADLFEVHRAVESQSDTRQWSAAADGAATPNLGKPPTAGAGPSLPRVPDHELLAELGAGGMGVVYRARHEKLKRLVALKMIRAGAGAGSQERDRFRREAEAVARLHHPHIVQIYETGECDGLPYFSMELVEGGNLAQKIAGKPLPSSEAACLLETLARAVHHAHQAGVIHRDLKPSNVLLAACGPTEGDARPQAAVPKITDFGLAKRLDGDPSSQTHSGSVVGTPSYMPPEQARGNVRELGPAADIYSLGAVLYECLTGRPPFLGATALETVLMVINTDPVPPRRLNPQVPRDLETICLKCLEKQQTRRYADAGGLADDLARFRDGRPILARPAGVWERAWKWARRRPTAAALAAVTVLAVAALLVVGTIFNTMLGVRLAENERLGSDLKEQRARLDAKEKELKAQREATDRADEAAQARAAQAHTLAARQAFERNDVPQAQDQLDDCPYGRRGWEWHQLRALCDADRLTFDTDPHGAHCVAVSPDGELLAVGVGEPVRRGAVGTVRLFRLAPGRRRVQNLAGHTAPVNCVAFCPGRPLLASASFRIDFEAAKNRRVAPPTGEVIIWELDAAKKGRPLQPLDGYGTVAFSRDGDLLACAGTDQTVHVWDVETWEELTAVPPVPGAFVKWVAFGPGGLLAEATASAILDPRGMMTARSQVRLWDLTAGREVWSVVREPLEVSAVAFDPEGKWLSVSGVDQTLLLLDATTGREAKALVGHKDIVRTAAFSPQGDVVATGSKDRSVRVWDAATGREWAVLRGHAGSVESVAFVPGRPRGEWRLVSGGEDGTVKVWDAATCRGFAVPGGHDGLVRHVVFSPDGRLLASSGADGRVKIWDMQERKLLRSLECLAEKVAFSPDGKWLATGGADALRRGQTARVQLWEVAAESEPRTLRTVEGEPILSVAFSPDGRRLAVSHGMLGAAPLPGGKAVALAVADGTVEATFEADLGVPTALAYSPDGRRLVATGWNGAVQVFPAEGGKPIRTLRAHGRSAAYSLAVAPDGRFATGDTAGTIFLWGADSAEPIRRLRGHDGSVSGLSFGAGGRRLVSAGIGFFSGRSEIRLWDTESGEEVLNFPGVYTVAFSPDGRRLAAPWAPTLLSPFEVRIWEAPPDELFTARADGAMAYTVAVRPGGGALASGHSDGKVRLWDAVTGQPSVVMTGHSGDVQGVAFSPDGSRIATAGADKTVRLWDAESHNELWKGQGHEKGVFDVCFGPDGRLLASSGYDRNVRLWDADTGEPGLVLEGAGDVLFRVSFSPDGESVAAACKDGSVLVWDVATGETLHKLTAHDGPAVAVAFHPGGRWLVTGGADGLVRVWDAATGKPVRTLDGDPWQVVGLAFSPDGRLLACGGHDHAVHIWHFDSGRELRTIRGHRTAVWAVAFHADGKHLFSASTDGTVRAWDVSAEKKADIPVR
jgi:WD40 repeat protein